MATNSQKTKVPLKCRDCDIIVDCYESLERHTRYQHQKTDHNRNMKWYCYACGLPLTGKYHQHTATKSHLKAVDQFVAGQLARSEEVQPEINAQLLPTLEHQQEVSNQTSELYNDNNYLNDSAYLSTQVDNHKYRNIKTFDFTKQDFTETGLLHFAERTKLSSENFEMLCNLVKSPHFQKDKIPQNPISRLQQFREFKSKDNEKVTISENGPIRSVTPMENQELGTQVLRVESNWGPMILVDPIMEIAKIIGDPVLAPMIEPVAGILPPNGVISSWNHTDLVQSNPFWCGPILPNNYGLQFHHGDSVKVRLPATEGFLARIFSFSWDTMQHKQRVTLHKYYSKTEVQRLPWYPQHQYPNMQEIWETDERLDYIDLDFVVAKITVLNEQDYADEQTKPKRHSSYSNIYLCQHKLFLTGHYFQPFRNAPPPMETEDNPIPTQRIMLKVFSDGHRPFRTRSKSSLLHMDFTLANIPARYQLDNTYTRFFANFEKHVPHDVAYWLLAKSLAPLIPGCIMTNYQNQQILVKGGIAVMLCDSPEACLATNVKAPGAWKGDRHLQATLDDIQRPIDGIPHRNPEEDMKLWKRIIKYSGTQQETALKEAGLKKTGTVLLRYFQEIRQDLYLSFPNCLLHCLSLNILQKIFHLIVEVLNPKGIHQLQLILHNTDALSTGKLGKNQRLQNFVTEYSSLIGTEVDEIMPVLSYIFRYVLHKEYLKPKALELFQHIENNDFQAFRQLVTAATNVYFLLKSYTLPIATLPDIQQTVESFRQLLFQISKDQFGRLPVMLQLAVLSHQQSLRYYGPPILQSTAPGEKRHIGPHKAIEHSNNRDVALQVAFQLHRQSHYAYLYANAPRNSVLDLLNREVFHNTWVQPPEEHGEISTAWLQKQQVPRYCQFGISVSGAAYGTTSKNTPSHRPQPALIADILKEQNLQDELLTAYHHLLGSSDWKELQHKEVHIMSQLKSSARKWSRKAAEGRGYYHSLTNAVR